MVLKKLVPHPPFVLFWDTATTNYSTAQKYANITNALLTNPQCVKIFRAFLSTRLRHAFLPTRWPLLFITNIPFVMHCYDEQNV